MIDKTPLEQQALEAALRPLGEVAAEIGFDKPLAAYTKEQALTVIEAIVSGYQARCEDSSDLGPLAKIELGS
jgi:hypothetical protein